MHQALHLQLLTWYTLPIPVLIPSCRITPICLPTNVNRFRAAVPKATDVSTMVQNDGSEQGSYICSSFSALPVLQQLLPLWHSRPGGLKQSCLCRMHAHPRQTCSLQMSSMPQLSHHQVTWSGASQLAQARVGVVLQYQLYNWVGTLPTFWPDALVFFRVKVKRWESTYHL